MGIHLIESLENFAQTGDTVITAASDYSLLSAYAMRRLDGSLTVLAINIMGDGLRDTLDPRMKSAS